MPDGTQPPRGLQYGTIVAGGTSPTVRLDGTTTTLAISLSPPDVALAAADRVLVTTADRRVGIVNRVGAPPAGTAYVKKAGDTMTGALTMNGGGNEMQRLVTAGAFMSWYNAATTLRTGYIQGNDTGGILINSEQGPLDLRGATGKVSINGTSLNLGTPSKYGGAYSGLNWGADYLIMTDTTNTFVSTPGTGGSVLIRAGVNGTNQLNINSNGAHVLTGSLASTGDIHSGSWLYADGRYLVLGTGWDGNSVGWYAQDSTWVRSVNSKSVYAGGGIFSCEGGFSAGMGGGLTAGYIADFNGSVYTGHLNTRVGYRVTSNGQAGGQYYNAAFLAQQGGEARASYGMHPGGNAGNMGMVQNGYYITFWNVVSADNGDGRGGLGSCYAWEFAGVSTEKMKQDIAPWPPKSLGAASMGAISRLSLIDVRTYRAKKKQALGQTFGVRRDKAHDRLNDYCRRRGLEPRPYVLHDCRLHDCKGTDPDTDPCPRVKNWANPAIGVVIEDIATVLPEVVAYSDEDGSPAGVRLGSMIGFLLAVCKEQQGRIEELESVVNSAFHTAREERQ